MRTSITYSHESQPAEVCRIATMTNKALMTRINKIRKAEKLESFIEVGAECYLGREEMCKRRQERCLTVGWLLCFWASTADCVIQQHICLSTARLMCRSSQLLASWTSLQQLRVDMHRTSS